MWRKILKLALTSYPVQNSTNKSSFFFFFTADFGHCWCKQWFNRSFTGFCFGHTSGANPWTFSITYYFSITYSTKRDSIKKETELKP